MEKGFPIRSARVHWEVVMVLEDASPRLEEIILEEINTIGRVLNVLPAPQAKHARASYWRTELLRLRAHLPEESRARTKRGLLDIVGTLGHTLFGIATDKDIGRLQDKVLENRNSLNGILHVQKEFLSIVNISHSLINQNRDAILNLTNTLNELRVWMRRILVQMDQHVHGIIVYNHIREQVLRITQHVDIYKEVVRTQARTRATLEGGKLRESLLPRQVLVDLANLQNTRAELVQPLEFYYMNVEIIPLWKGEILGFKVSIPLVDSAVFMGYQIKSFPVPLSNESATFTIQGGGQLAVDPHTGGVFQANDCLGTQTIVCPPSPVRRDMGDPADESCGSLLTPPGRGFVPVISLPSTSASGIIKVPLVVPSLDPHQNSLDGKNLDLLPKESKS